jgi:hypothetical protein
MEGGGHAAGEVAESLGFERSLSMVSHRSWGVAGKTAEHQQQHDSYDPLGKWPVVPASGIGMDPSGAPGVQSSLKPLAGIFAHVLAPWSGAETTEAQLDLLKSLGNQRPTTLPESVDVGSTWQGWLRCEWELPRVARQLRQESQSTDIESLLANFVIITGSSSDMECSTCAQFLKKEWKESGVRALEVLSRGVWLEKFSTITSRSKLNQNMEIHATESHLIVRIRANQPDAQSFIDAIVWACTAIRINPRRKADSGNRSELQMSKAIQLGFLTSLRSQALVYGLEPLTDCSDEDIGPQAKCWKRLFNSGIVAFHPLGRRWGAGLKLSFDMMLHLSGVENIYHIDGGIILLGFFTALVPISYDEDTNIVQWHFEEVSGLSEGLLKPCSLRSVRGKWYQTQDIDLLRSSRCFLGWFARANILLGTRQLVESPQGMLKWSIGTTEHHQSVRREGFEAAGQLGFTAGPINTNVQLVSTWRFHSNVQHFHRHEQYSTALRLGRGNVAVVIDSESKQVWLVPMLSVVLHLCHRYFQELNLGNLTDNPLPFADPSPDGASEAARVLESSGDVIVFGAVGDPHSECLRQLFLRINTNLLNASGTREPSNKKTLFASELMAMITEPGRGSPLKKMKAPADAESWVGLLERVDFVGVCANIGPLIKPEPPSHSPCTCSALPSDRYFLAAHMRCLDALSKRAGDGIRDSLNKACRLGETVFWNADKVHWTSCPAGIHDPIWNEKGKILQQISSKEKGKGKDVSGLNGQTVAPRDLPEDGAVVFGGDPSRRIIQSWRLSDLILQERRITPA